MDGTFATRAFHTGFPVAPQGAARAPPVDGHTDIVGAGSLLRIELADDVEADLLRPFGIVRRKRDCTDHGVSSAAVAAANLRYVVTALDAAPGVVPDRNLAARAAARDHHRIDALGKQRVGDELT